jgi:acyl carrier protein
MTDDQATHSVGPPFSEEAVIALIAQKVQRAPGYIRPDQALVEDFGFDSIDLIQLVMAVEQALQIKIDDRGAARIRTIEDLLSVSRQAYLSAPTL